jgi:tRNA(adenine34) deaminase
MASSGDDDAAFMAEALAAAAAAGARGEVPVGAVVVIDGLIVARAGNEREALADPTAHAEVLALRRAAALGGSWRLETATVYATLEPCPMCAGALVSARVARLVFATPDPKAGACGSLYNLGADPRLNHEFVVEAGVGAEAARALLQSWFASRRHGSP